MKNGLVKSFIGKIWALPATAFGLIPIFIGLCIAPRKIKIRLAHNAICFYNFPLLKGKYKGLTLGNMIFFQCGGDYIGGCNIAEHEKQHTYQAEILGFLYIPLHIIFFFIYHRNVMKNPLERGPYSNPPRPWYFNR